MNYEFPIINNISDVLPASIRGCGCGDAVTANLFIQNS